MSTEPMQQDTQPAGPPTRKNRRVPYTTVINLVLFVGLIIIYALFFMQKGADETDQQDQLVEMSERISEAGASIAYINSEVFMEEYALAIKMREDFEGEQRRLEGELERRQRNFQTEVERFQQNISTGAITMDQAQIREQELMQMQQELIQLSDTYRERLAVKEYEMNLELLENISDFLERYNLEAGYDFILNYTPGGGILFAKPTNEITREVLDRLNDEYSSTQ